MVFGWVVTTGITIILLAKVILINDSSLTF